MASGVTSFNPAEAKIRFALQPSGASGGVLPTAGWHQNRTSTVAFTASREDVEDTSLDADGLATENFDGKFSPEGSLEYNVFAEDHGLLLANAQLFGATTTLETGVVYQHKLAPTETTNDYQCLVADQDRAIGLRDFWSDVVTESVTFSFAPNGVLTASQTFQNSGFHRWEAGAQTSGTGTTVPQIRGLLTDTERALSDSDLFIEYQSVAGLPTSVTVRAKLGSAASFAGSGVTVEAATWTTLVDENDVEMGIDGLQIYIPDFTGATAADTFEIESSRPTWTTSLPTRVDFNEINIVVTVDGSSFSVQDGSVTITNAWQQPPVVGGVFPDPSRRRGKRAVEWTFNRDMVDVNHLNRLETGERFDIEVTCGSKVEVPSTAENRTYELKFISKNCKATGPEATVTDATSLTETVTASAARSTDSTYPADVTLLLTNGTANLGA